MGRFLPYETPEDQRWVKITNGLTESLVRLDMPEESRLADYTDDAGTVLNRSVAGLA